MKNGSILMLFGTVLMSGVLSAAPCNLKITREACPGKEKESFSKCGGNKSCIVKGEKSDISECINFAMENCKNARFDITKYKMVQVQFQGSNLENGLDYCSQDRGTYKVKENYPFKNNISCQ